MKTLLVQLSISLGLISFSMHAGAGVDSSGGGVGGNFQISSGYQSGNFSVHLQSAASGSLGSVVKYLKLAGATESSDASGSTYALGAASISQSNSLNDNDPNYFLMNMTIPFDKVYGVASAGERATLEFGGPIAHALYEAMAKNGAKIYAKNLDQQRNVIGFTLSDDGEFICHKVAERAQRGSTFCTISVSTKLPPKNDSCAECGG